MQTTTNTNLLNKIDQKLIHLALEEDLGVPFRDVTTQCLMANHQEKVSARIISKHVEPIVICGIPVVRAILETLHTAWSVSSPMPMDARGDVVSSYEDGMTLAPGEVLMTLSGNPQLLLMAERTVLNFLQHLCAVATLTARFVAKVRHTRAQILDTRKTTPGWRHLEKYAVQCGGGVNHRMGLYDAIMIKDTHIDVAGGIDKALATLSSGQIPALPIIVEVRDKAELMAVLDNQSVPVTRVLLDNMSLSCMRECVLLCQGVMATEASGGISLDNAAAIAETGVDYLSVGRLTHSACHVDLSMKSGLKDA